ncbi:tape measure protein [Tetragenococcus halophilus]|uniref:tape measure protein n=1 Tax=Tetragenococcus halophilus TaxID=51669 RepID=UPI00209AB767|nr:tape measure protein [Tetragenococcus halophilus]MCO8294510.1 tape measure protein [Tetragenococcus halophilus]
MAERIKGLQIDLSLDSMNVSKGLAGVKREMRALNSSMKVSNNNFKHGDKSASAYKDRMSELQTAVDGSSKHLDQLKSAHADVVAEQGAGSKAALDYANEINRETDTLNMFKSQLSQVTQEYKQNYSVAGRIGKSFGAIGSSMQTVGDKMQSVGSAFTSHITKPAGIAAAAVGGLTAKLGFDRLVGLDTAKAKLEGLGYSTKEVGSITGEVEEAIDGSMTTMAEGTDVAAGAMAAGVEQGDELQRYIKLVGDAAVGSGRDVGSMAQIFNRVQGQGKLMTQELNMVEEGMPGFSNAMAEHLGVGVEKFREMVTAGEVSSDDFLDVMDDFAGGMAESYSQSWQGMLQNTKAYIGQIGESLLGGVFEQAKGSLHEFEDILKSPAAQEWAAQTGQKIAETFTAMGNKISEAIDWWNGLDDSTQSTLGSIAKYAGIALVAMGPLFTIFGKFVGMFGKMFSGLSGLVGFFIKHNAAAKASAAAQSVWNGVTATARGVSSAYASTVAALGNSQILQSAKTKIATVATQVWTGVTKAASLAAKGLGLAFKFMTGPIGIIITAITAAVGIFMYFWRTNEGFRNGVINIWNTIKNAAMSIFSYIGSFISGVWQTVKNVSMTVWNALKTAASAIWNGIKYVIQNPIQTLKNILLTIWNGIKTTALTIWNLIKTGVLLIIKGWVNIIKVYINLIKTVVTTVFNAVKSFAITVWSAIKNTVVKLAKGLWNGVKNIFNMLKNGVTTIFNAVKNFIIKVWTTIKNTVIKLVKTWWQGIKNIFNALKSGTVSIFNSVKKFIVNTWNTIKNRVVNFAKALWNGVKNTFNSLKSGVSSIFNGVKDTIIKIWSTIKSKVQGFVNGMKDGVVGTLGKMRDTVEGIVDKIKGFFTGMVEGVVDGLNKLIDGVNWVGDKLGMDPIDSIELSTGTEHTETRNLITNGKVNQDTLATVGDKGKGNGPGGFRNEMIRYPNGKMFMTPNRDSTAYLPKGSSVYNGMQTHAMLNGMPAFANGTWWDKTKDFASGAFNKAKDAVGKSKDWLADKVGDVWDWVSKPGKLVDKVIKAFGVDFDWIQGSLPSDMMGAMFKKIKTAAKDLFTSWFDDAGGGDFDGEIQKGGKGNGVFKYLVDIANKVVKKFNMAGITSGYRPGDKYYHGKRQAIDVAYPSGMNGSKKYVDPANWAFNNFKDEVGYVIALNRIKDRTGDGGQGKTSKWANWPSGGHMDHLHINGRMGKGDISKGGASGKWGGDIKKALKLAGLPTTNAYVNAWKKQIQTESGGNPKALGGTDGLADGRAKGLVQVKPGTFNAHKLKGHGNIWNGLDNLIAGMRYAKKRHGKGGMLSFIGKGHGYSTGGLINSSGLYNLAEDGHPEFVIPTDPSKQSDAMKLLAIAANDIDRKKKGNKRPNQMRAPSTSANDSYLSLITDLLKENNQLVEQNNTILEKLREKDSNLYVDGRKMTKNLGGHIDREQGKRAKFNERGLAF